MNQSTFDRIRVIIVGQNYGTNLTFEDIKPDSTLESLKLDSLDAIELIMSTEEEFGIEINEDATSIIKTVQEFVDFVDKIIPKPDEAKLDKAWFEEFKGRCVSCERARQSSRKDEMLCNWRKAWNRGLPDRPGGMRDEEPVHKLFGCVYYVKADQARRN